MIIPSSLGDLLELLTLIFFLRDYHFNLIENEVDLPKSYELTTSSSNKYPLSASLSYHNLYYTHAQYILNMTSISESNNYEEAMSDENWSKAIQTKLTSLMKTNTWKLITLPKQKKDIEHRWVLKLKLHVNGYVKRYKAHLIAKGFTLTECLYYPDNLIPVVKMTTIRIFLTIAATQGWQLFQLDVNTTFFHGDLNEEVYM